MNIDRYIGPLKREYWEYQTSFLGGFAFLGGLLILLALFTAFTGGSGSMSFNIVVDGDGAAPSFTLEQLIDTKISGFVSGLLHTFVFISTIVSIYYYLGCLYDDRKDRSILFWKSLPISETQSVLTKFFTGLYVVPFIALVIGFVTSVVLSIMFTIWLPLITDYGVLQIWGKFNIVSDLLLGLLFIVVSGIWIAPFFAWIMLTSALSKRSPLMIATLPPILIILAENMLFGRSFFASCIRAYMPDTQAFNRYEHDMSWDTLGALIDAFILGPHIIFGIVITGILLFAAIWLRNNRYEI